MDNAVTPYNDDVTEPTTVATRDVGGAVSTRGPLVVNVPQRGDGDLNIGGEVNTTHNYNELHQHIECHGPIQCRRLVQTYNFNSYHSNVSNSCHSNPTARNDESEGDDRAPVEVEQNWFVQTDGLAEAQFVLEEQGLVVLSGFPGCGKTTAGHALLQQYSQRGFKSYTLANVHELNRRIRDTGNVVVLMDGVLGEVRVNTGEYEALRAIKGMVSQFMKAKTWRLILTMYPHVLREIDNRDSRSLRSLVNPADAVDFQKNPINDDQKEAILRGHLQELNLDTLEQNDLVREILQKDVSGAAFPWCCRQMVNEWQSKTDRTVFFTAPSEPHVTLLQRMLGDPAHGERFAAVMSLKMHGIGAFLHDPDRVRTQLKRLGFRTDVSCHRLEEYADILKGSILSPSGGDFYSRKMYDAVGLALGRSFRLPILLKVCDLYFLIQHVRTKETATKFSVTVGPSPDDRQLLMQTMYDHMVSGRLPELCQHPSLNCPKFLQEFEAFCRANKNYLQKLFKVVDTDHKLPLLFWSVWGPSGHLTEWCLNLTKQGIKMVGQADVFVKAAFAIALVQHAQVSTTRVSAMEQLLQLARLKLRGTFVNNIQFPLMPSDRCKTTEVKAIREKVATQLSSGSFCFLSIPRLPISGDLVRMGIQSSEIGDKVRVVVPSKHWYLALRLLSDREVDETDDEGNTLLHVAIENEDLDAMKIAIKSGASLTVRNNTGQTPPELHNTRRRWIRRSAFPTEHSPDALHNACKEGDQEKVKFLLCTGCTVHDKDPARNTPLHSACMTGQTDIAALLIDLNADVNARNDEQFKPHHYARINGHIETVELFEDADIEDDTDGTLDASDVRVRRVCLALLITCLLVIFGVLIVSLCFKLVSSPKKEMKKDSFVPRSDAEIKREKIMDFLLERTTLINMATKDVFTPLHLASASGRVESVRYLINSGADVNVKSGTGITPLQMASAFGQTGVASLLIDNNADVNHRETENGSTALHLATERGNVETVRLLLERGAKVNLKLRSGDTALFTASGSGRIKIARLLLEHGADINARNKMGFTPLHMACANNQTETVRFLLARGADANIRCKHGLAPLHIAVIWGQTQTSKMLIDNNADVNIKQMDGFSLLFLAVAKNHFEIARLLIRSKANLEVQDRHGYTPLHFASGNGLTKIVKLLVQNGASIDAKDKNGSTPVLVACIRNQTETVRFLAANGADVNVENDNGITPLIFACNLNLVEIARILIHNNANVNAQKEGGFTPLYLACFKNHTEIVRLLAANGADVNAKSDIGLTPLLVACIYGWVEVADILIQNNATINVKDVNGTTPLLAACMRNHTEIVRLLVANGADVNEKNSSGVTPLTVAWQHGMTEIASILIEKNADINGTFGTDTLLHLSCSSGKIEFVRLLLQKRYINMQNSDGRTPLHNAVLANDSEIVLLLVQNHANPNIKEHGGHMPLHFSIAFDKVNISRILLEHGADVNAKNKNELTPLHRACHTASAETVRLLMRHGADVNSRYDAGYTPLHAAAWCGNIGCAQALLESKVVTDLDVQSYKGDTPLHVGGFFGRTEIVQLLIQDGFDINAKNDEEKTPLHYACSEGQTESARLLIEAGADINVKDDEGNTPLHSACLDGQLEAARLLIQSGADINVRNEERRTPLHVATLSGHIKCVRLLLRKSVTSKLSNEINTGGVPQSKAYINLRDASGKTALHLAYINGHKHIARLLLHFGADADVEAKDGYTPLHFA